MNGWTMRILMNGAIEIGMQVIHKAKKVRA